jgi:hypothetical protein
MKSLWKSKTFWVAVINAAILAFEPTVLMWVKENPSIYASIISFVFILLRFFTNKGIK